MTSSTEPMLVGICKLNMNAFTRIQLDFCKITVLTQLGLSRYHLLVSIPGPYCSPLHRQKVCTLAEVEITITRYLLWAKGSDDPDNRKDPRALPSKTIVSQKDRM